MIRTRFAPSPTGMLHVGGARTALFNYLFSRHHGGQFLLRIEDTDRARSTEAAVRAILDGLSWLGLDPDEPPVFQSTREARHAEVAHALVQSGQAYRCWLSQEELAAMRAEAAAAKRPLRIVSPWRDRDPAEAPAGVAPVIRLRAPHAGETVIHDLIQGEVRVANAELDDLVILRSDGSPTYLHAVVVDDHDMAISHVIRGDDHLTNTFRQALVFAALGWELPAFAHVPMIHGADGAKLSKRHGAQSVTEFRDAGFLPEALGNYLLRLGWGHGDDEVIGREAAIRLFEIGDVGRAPSRMDYAKLTHLNGVWLRQAEDGRLAADVLARLAGRPGLVLDEAAATRIRALMPGLKERAKTLADLADAAAFLARRAPLPLEPKAEALLTPPARQTLRSLGETLRRTEFDAAALDAALRAFAAGAGKKLGEVAQPLRAALTGSTTSPGIDATLAALGREESLARIDAVAA